MHSGGNPSPAESRRVPFFLYADEFQNFQTSAFDTILSEAGGYKLCLTLANQGLYQLEPRIKDAIFTNVTGGWAVFHIDEKDVPNFKLKTQPLDAEQLASLPPHTAFIKIGIDDPGILKTPPPVSARGPSCADYIRKQTLERFRRDTRMGFERRCRGSREQVCRRGSSSLTIAQWPHRTALTGRAKEWWF